MCGTRRIRSPFALFFDSLFGNPVEIAAGMVEVRTDVPGVARFVELLTEARDLIAQEGFVNWQVAFPGVWEEWRSAAPRGGFDAVIGNPPWDRVKLQQVEWFAARRPRDCSRPTRGRPQADDWGVAKVRRFAGRGV